MPGKRFRLMLGVSGVGLMVSCAPSLSPPVSRDIPVSVPEPRPLVVAPRNVVARPAAMELSPAWMETPFVRQQLSYSRVRSTRFETQLRLKQLFADRRIAYPAAELFVRVFKRTRQLEVWVRADGERQFQLLAMYSICALAGMPGPKLKRGDAQVPEGFYSIEAFNPASQYHLSLKIDYPNARDRAANPKGDLGGDIFIHGGCKSEGCLAIGDDGIEELYWLAVAARARGQLRIPVHIFPARLDDAELRRMDFSYRKEPALVAFWKTLKPGYDYFERTRRVPFMTAERGRYLLED